MAPLYSSLIPNIYGGFLRMYFLLSILIFFVVLSNINPNDGGETAYIELIQVAILFFNLLFQLKFQNFFQRIFSKTSLTLRSFLIIFLLYEELSFLTKGKFDLFNNLSDRSEVNLHNLSLIQTKFLQITIPFLNFSFGINAFMLLITLSLFIIGYGSYLPFLKKFRFIFLEKKYSFFSFIFILNIILKFISREIFNSSFIFLSLELCELFIYLLLLLDLIHKKKNIDFISSK